MAWLGPMLIPIEYQKDQYIYLEGETANYIYFIMQGQACFVLPRF